MTAPTRVAVALSPPLERFAATRSDFAEEFRRLLDEIVGDLGLPEPAVLEVSRGKTPPAPGGAALCISIGDVPCRMPAGAAFASAAEPLELAREAARIVHQNRALLVTPAVATRLQAKWAAERPALAGAPAELVHAVLAELVRGGFRLDRAKEVPVWDAAGALPEAAAALAVQATRRVSASRLDLALGSLDSTTDDMPFAEMLPFVQDGIFYELGLRVPRIAGGLEPALEPAELRIRINDVRWPPQRGLAPDQFLANDRPARLRELGVEGEPALNPASGNEHTIVREKDGAKSKCAAAGLTTWGPLGYAVLVLSAGIRRNAGSLVTMEKVDFDLRLLQQAFPDLVVAARQRFELVQLTRIVQGLLAEQISVRNLRGLLESLLAVVGVTDVDLSRLIAFLPTTGHLYPVSPGKGVGDLSVADYVNCARLGLKSYISHKYTRGAASLVVLLMSPEGEKRLAAAEGRPLSADEHARLVASVLAEVAVLPPSTTKPVVLTSIEARRALRQALEIEFPDLPSVCYQELVPELNIQPIARIEYESEPPATTPTP